MPNFSIGLSALQTSQFALEMVSNNISNANTDGYHRRSLTLQATHPDIVGGFRVGTGVTISGINRVRDSVTEASLTSVISDSSDVEQLLNIERKIESALLTGDNSIGRQLDAFFAEFTNLSASPNEPAQRSALLETGKQLTGGLRDAAQQLTELKGNIRLQIEHEIELLNGDLGELRDVSFQIFKFEAQGIEHNNELDQRDAVLNRIAEVVGIRRNEQPGGQLHLTIGHHSIEQGSHPSSLSVIESGQQLEIYLDDSDRPLAIETGRLSALVEAYNEIIPAYEEKLDQIAGELIQSVNRVHSTGIGSAGSFTNLVGNVSVSQTNIPLNEALPDADLTAGELTLSVTDANGDRQTHVITIDPDVDTLEDVAAQLSSILGITSSIRAVSNQFQITTGADVEFDFAGGVETNPDLSLFTGTSVASVSGTYTGEVNEELTVRIEGSGQVGSAANLFANVYSSSGALLSRVNVGDGYEAGSPIELDDGVSIAFTAGTMNDADEFSTRLTGEPDQTGILAALGINAFFSGTDAHSIAVDRTLASQPERIATGRSGEAADTSNLSRFIAIADTTLMPSNRTLGQFASEMGTEIGFEISSNTSLSASLTTFKLRLETERDAISGVDLNEELVYLQEYQKSYEAAVRIIQATDEMLSELFRIIG
ncbi:Flagellar hook-associated protein 1 [Stieleria maiorica]|uniref:Flagellar hook-associated protein 1 n=1 Tax=Stieleria maiorica TaxID=2795974 RepID=A0A5B9MB36_9BACT|nr:flagellar hook-associated protein FlgK [Stieleria maiorica]QEF98511.1 Flagellar hook-associated protein 1 [Stieleria maiorica]